MPQQRRHYGWECSPYSAKTRAYLRYKEIPHQDISPTAIGMKWVLERKVGFMIMPVVLEPDGTVLQDTSDIIDELEAKYPDRSIHPTEPTQKLVSFLFELMSDEWLPLLAMHTRWNIPENKRFAHAEFGRCALPWLPRFAQRKLGSTLAAKMSSYLPILGITETTAPAITTWGLELLDRLEAHFSSHLYLLGDRPCLGDFALYGPLYAHVWRDPGSRDWVESRPALYAWLTRLREGESVQGDWIADDQIPDTLTPIMKRMFAEQGAVLAETLARVNEWASENPTSKKPPRGLGRLTYSIGGVHEKRICQSFQQWMFQRSWRVYREVPVSSKPTVDRWLEKTGGLSLLSQELAVELARENFRLVVVGR